MQPRFEQQHEPSIRVLEGQHSEADRSSRMLALFKIAIVLVVMITAFAVARIWLTNASMSMLLQTNEVKEEIATARQAGSALEVQYYNITDPAKVKSYASNKLGMSPVVGTITYVDLTPNYVVASVPSLVDEVAPQGNMLSSRGASPELVTAYSGAVAKSIADSEKAAEEPAEPASGEEAAQSAAE
ncbi:MAG: hypothetical protein K6G78_04185 [bacterium]|nr:hypothetical protein [bacterium]